MAIAFVRRAAAQRPLASAGVDRWGDVLELQPPGVEECCSSPTSPLYPLTGGEVFLLLIDLRPNLVEFLEGLGCRLVQGVITSSGDTISISR